MEYTLTARSRVNPAERFSTIARFQDPETARFGRDLFSVWGYEIEPAPSNGTGFTYRSTFSDGTTGESIYTFANEEAARFHADYTNDLLTRSFAGDERGKAVFGFDFPTWRVVRSERNP